MVEGNAAQPVAQEQPPAGAGGGHARGEQGIGYHEGQAGGRGDQLVSTVQPDTYPGTVGCAGESRTGHSGEGAGCFPATGGGPADQDLPGGVGMVCGLAGIRIAVAGRSSAVAACCD